MVSNILFPPTYARHGIFPPRVLPTQSHVMPSLEIAKNLNLNTHKGGFLHRSRCPPSESHPIDCHKYFRSSIVPAILVLLLRLLLLLLLLLPHQTWVGFGHVEKGAGRRKLGHLVEVERVFCLEVDLHQSHRRRRWWCHFPSFRSVIRVILALRRWRVVLTTVAAAAAITGGPNRRISLWWLRRSFSGVELRWWRCRTGSVRWQRWCRRRLNATTAERFLLTQLAARRRYDRAGRGRTGQGCDVVDRSARTVVEL